MTGTNRSYGHVKREFVDACKRALLERELERRMGKERERAKGEKGREGGKRGESIGSRESRWSEIGKAGKKVGQLERVGNGPTSEQREITFSIFGGSLGADGNSNFCSSVRLIFNSIRGELECCRARRSAVGSVSSSSLQIFQRESSTQLLVSGTKRKRRGRGNRTRLKILRRPVTNCEIDTKPL